MSKEILLNKISQSIVDMQEDEVVELCKECLNTNITPNEIISQGLIKGMDEVSKLFEEEEYFLPEVLMADLIL